MEHVIQVTDGAKITIFLNIWLLEYKSIFNDLEILHGLGFHMFRFDGVIVHFWIVLCCPSERKIFTIPNITFTFCQINRRIGLKHRYPTQEKNWDPKTHFHFVMFTWLPNSKFSQNYCISFFSLILNQYKRKKQLGGSRYQYERRNLIRTDHKRTKNQLILKTLDKRMANRLNRSSCHYTPLAMESLKSYTQSHTKCIVFESFPCRYVIYIISSAICKH